MSRLVVVSNRVADLEKSAQSGGLAVALADALTDTSGLWFGWDGRIVDNAASLRVTIDRQRGAEIATVPLTKAEHTAYYLGFSNKVLWPAFHYRLDLAEMSHDDLEGYRSVNRRFAATLRPLLADDDIVWVHDYHLIPFGAELRAHGARQPIGFFLHVPLPPEDIVQAVPDHEWLIRSLFSYDLIGFQTEGDVEKFIHYVENVAGGAHDGAGRVTAFGRTTVARAFPISIDVDAFSALAAAPAAAEHISRLERRSMAMLHIIGVDRLDYSKGLPDRMKAFRRLLELYPENRKYVTFMQIAPPTREEVEAYSDIREDLERLSGAINGEFGDYDWTPVRYVHRSLPRSTLAALYRGCRVGLVTPLRDGMNLVAKEYVAAQDPDNPGVLVLSQFAGAAEQMDEALIVNPYDIDVVAAAIETAITMHLGERRERHCALMERLRSNDVAHWRATFLEALSRAAAAASSSR